MGAPVNRHVHYTFAHGKKLVKLLSFLSFYVEFSYLQLRLAERLLHRAFAPGRPRRGDNGRAWPLSSPPYATAYEPFSHSI
jgi:hypothetical protein